MRREIPAMEVSDLRRRLRQVIDDHRRSAALKRARIDAARTAYEAFLRRAAQPAFRMLAMALAAEGFPFRVSHPAGSLRLAAERQLDDFIEIELDSSGVIPLVMGRTSQRRGSRVSRAERPMNENVPLDQLTSEDVMDFLLREVPVLLER